MEKTDCTEEEKKMVVMIHGIQFNKWHKMSY